MARSISFRAASYCSWWYRTAERLAKMMAMSFATVGRGRREMYEMFPWFPTIYLTVFGRQHEVAFVVKVQRLVPLFRLKELVPNFLHLQSAVLIFVEVDFLFVDLVPRVALVTCEFQLLVELAHVVGEPEPVLVAREGSERLNLVALQRIAGVVVEVDEESTFQAVHFDFSIGKFRDLWRSSENFWETDGKTRKLCSKENESQCAAIFRRKS